MASISELKKYLRYQDGKLIWKNKLKTKSATRRWAGKIAGDKKKNGYWYIGFCGERLLQHRVIFAIHHGYWPDEVDHIDGNPDNNNIKNLRCASRTQNARNIKRRADNRSGILGINHHQKGWKVRIGSQYVGYSGCFAEAVRMRKSAECENMYHKNHGRWT